MLSVVLILSCNHDYVSVKGVATDETLCTLDLAFDAATPDAVVEKLPVRVNAEVVARTGSLARLVRDNVRKGPEHGFSSFGDSKDRFPRDAAKVVSFDVPGRLLRDFYNAVEQEPSYGTPGNLVWAQFRLRESPRTCSPTAAPPPRAP